MGEENSQTKAYKYRDIFGSGLFCISLLLLIAASAFFSVTYSSQFMDFHVLTSDYPIHSVSSDSSYIDVSLLCVGVIYACCFVVSDMLFLLLIAVLRRRPFSVVLVSCCYLLPVSTVVFSTVIFTCWEDLSAHWTILFKTILSMLILSIHSIYKRNITNLVEESSSSLCGPASAILNNRQVIFSFCLALLFIKKALFIVFSTNWIYFLPIDSNISSYIALTYEATRVLLDKMTQNIIFCVSIYFVVAAQKKGVVSSFWRAVLCCHMGSIFYGSLLETMAKETIFEVFSLATQSYSPYLKIFFELVAMAISLLNMFVFTVVVSHNKSYFSSLIVVILKGKESVKSNFCLLLATICLGISWLEAVILITCLLTFIFSANLLILKHYDLLFVYVYYAGLASYEAMVSFVPVIYACAVFRSWKGAADVTSQAWPRYDENV